MRDICVKPSCKADDGKEDKHAACKPDEVL